MFFKPNAKKLLEEFNAAPKGLEEMRRIRDHLHSIGEKNPAALVELLDEQNSSLIGRAIRKSGKNGLDLLFGIIRRAEHPLRAAAIKALWEFGYDAASHLDEIVELFEDADPEVR